MSDNRIELEYRGRLGVVTINRPLKRNAFDDEMFAEFERVTGQLEKNMPRVVVVTGAGSAAFCAGFDVNPNNPMNSDMLRAVDEKDEQPAQIVINRVREVMDRFVALPVPIIAAVNGQAYGGGAELATRCDLRVMDPDAVFCFSEVRLGLMPDWGGSPSLVQLVGPAVAADLILTARKVSADEAFRLKLANRVSQPGKALEEAVELGESIAANGPRAVRAALDVIRSSPSLVLADALALEASNAVSLITSGEYIYGVSAFLNRKPPEFPDES